MRRTEDDSEEQREHLSYLLRLWLVSEEGHPVWRASLKSAQTGRALGFRCLEELFEYLQAQATAVTGGSGHKASEGG